MMLLVVFIAELDSLSIKLTNMTPVRITVFGVPEEMLLAIFRVEVDSCCNH